jgi:hypothetical protein
MEEDLQEVGLQEANLKDLLQQYYAEHGYAFDAEDNEGLYETFKYRSKTVWTGEPDHHRWYTYYDVIRKFTVGGKDYFFEDSYMSVDGDNSRSDCGWETPNVEDIVQVFPKQVLTTIYVTKDKL